MSFHACVEAKDMVMDTLRAAVRYLTAAPLDHTGRRFPGWWDCPVRAELHPGWDHRRLRPGLAANCGGVVCAAGGVPADRWMIFLHHGNMENCRSCRWKSHSQPDGKRQAFSHSLAILAVYAHSHTAYCGGYSCFPIKAENCLSLNVVIMFL